MTPEAFETSWNAALFLRLALLSTFIRHEDGAFWNCSSGLFKPEEFKTADFPFNADRKHFENEEFWKRWRHDNQVISLPDCFSNTNPQWTGINSFGTVRTGNIWCVFESETSAVEIPAA